MLARGLASPPTTRRQSGVGARRGAPRGRERGARPGDAERGPSCPGRSRGCARVFKNLLVLPSERPGGERLQRAALLASGEPAPWALGAMLWLLGAHFGCRFSAPHTHTPCCLIATGAGGRLRRRSAWRGICARAPPSSPARGGSLAAGGGGRVAAVLLSSPGVGSSASSRPPSLPASLHGASVCTRVCGMY